MKVVRWQTVAVQAAASCGSYNIDLAVPGRPRGDSKLAPIMFINFIGAAVRRACALARNYRPAVTQRSVDIAVRATLRSRCTTAIMAPSRGVSGTSTSPLADSGSHCGAGGEEQLLYNPTPRAPDRYMN